MPIPLLHISTNFRYTEREGRREEERREEGRREGGRREGGRKEGVIEHVKCSYSCGVLFQHLSQ